MEESIKQNKFKSSLTLRIQIIYENERPKRGGERREKKLTEERKGVEDEGVRGEKQRKNSKRRKGIRN